MGFSPHRVLIWDAGASSRASRRFIATCQGCRWVDVSSSLDLACLHRDAHRALAAAHWRRRQRRAARLHRFVPWLS